ncbi:hypothetical protein [Paraburkholderia sp. BL18I3N2]|uniref:hypothetical protein n=1 Tax=Paraburkholderia sp. BL18I3N2 TaxID=1938799 RepID=UPI0011B1E902|nr:hypothetical protein [Paraburkholderia sp. BL18I3N2]
MRPAPIAMPETAADAKIADLPAVTFIWLKARIGPTRAMPQERAPKTLRALRAQLVMLSEA